MDRQTKAEGRPRESEDSEALAWLRSVLLSIVEVAPLSPWLKRDMNSLIRKVPERLLNSWAGAVGCDYAGVFNVSPEFTDVVKSDTGRAAVAEYIDKKDAQATANLLDQLKRRSLKLIRIGKLPIAGEAFERQAVAVAMTCCAPGGEDFAAIAKPILADPEEQPTHLVIDYNLALERRELGRLNALDTILDGNNYGSWVDRRLEEMRWYFGLDIPRFHLQYGRRTPQWDSLWRNAVLGGKEGYGE